MFRYSVEKFKNFVSKNKKFLFLKNKYSTVLSCFTVYNYINI